MYRRRLACLSALSALIILFIVCAASNSAQALVLDPNSPTESYITNLIGTPTRTATARVNPTPTATLPHSFELIDRERTRGAITKDQAALFKVYALFKSDQLPARFRSAVLIPGDGTSALRNALQDWNQLSDETRRTIANFITPKRVGTGAPRGPAPTSTPIPSPKTLRASQGSPIMFIENVGQFDARSRFHVQGGSENIFIANDAIWVTLLEKTPSAQPSIPTLGRQDNIIPAAVLSTGNSNASRASANLKISFTGSNPASRPEPFGRIQPHVSYLVGNSTKWRSNVPVWSGVRFKDLYPGIDLEIIGEAGKYVHRMIARPGANIGSVRMRVEGADSLNLEGSGLRINTALGQRTLPLFQVTTPDGKPFSQIPPKPTLQGNEISAPFTSSVATTSTVLGTDLIYSTLLGGSGDDIGNGIAVDANGAAYIVGSTYSTDFPTKSGFQAVSGGNRDVFVSKLDLSNNTLVYSTYLGGSAEDDGYAIAVDSNGAAYVTGATYSTNFPVTSGAFQTTCSGCPTHNHAFVSKLSPDGATLQYSTFLGSTGADYGYGIAVVSIGVIFVSGSTNWRDFPITSGAAQTTWGGGVDAFMVKLNPAGTGASDLVYSTFLGGSGDDYGYRIAVDSSGAAYITGNTSSTNLRTTSGAYQTAKKGGTWDVYVAKINPIKSGASDLVYSTYLGDSSDDLSIGIGVNSSGSIYVSGYTNSANFPVTPGAFQPTCGSCPSASNVFVSIFNPAGSGINDLIYSTFLGGAANSLAQDLAVDAYGAAYVTGITWSTKYPTSPQAFQTSCNGCPAVADAFVTKLSPSGNGTSDLAYSTFIGGSITEIGYGITTSASSVAYVTGGTWSPDFPSTTTSVCGGCPEVRDAFVVRLAMPNYAGTPKYSVQILGCTLDHQYFTSQGHFLIWYTTTGNCAITGGDLNAYLNTLTTGFENGFGSYSSLGYLLPSPLPYQVYVVPVFTQTPGATFATYTLMTNTVSTNTDRLAVVAHEFFHGVQWTYQKACPKLDLLQVTQAWYNNEDLRWWMEVTAEWAQHKAITNDTSYTSGLPDYLNKPWQHMDTSPIQQTDNFAYSVLFPFYLIEHTGGGSNESIIRSTWQQYQQTGNCGAMKPVLATVLGAQSPAASIEQIFPQYTEANYFLAYNQPELTDFRNAVRGGNAFRPPADQPTFNDQTLIVAGPIPSYGGVTVDRLATAYIEFLNGFAVKNLGRALDVKLNLSILSVSNPITPVIKVWTITQAAPPVSSSTLVPTLQPLGQIGLTNSYSAEVIVPNFDAYQWVAVEVVNPQTSDSKLSWSYTASIIAPTPTPTPTMTPTNTPTPTPTP